MCGIAGHVGPTARELLPAMLGLLKHRGPDDSGIHVSADVGLGMTRLAIIDLVTGQQPMSDPTGRYWIVFNGEIYNFRQLRAALEADGRRFRTRSDTEVILHAYAAYGEACVERLSGMFAFAIWDGAERRLFLARDRLGKKPLYYWHRGHLFLFASEPKALLCHPAVSRALDWPAFHHYLAFGYTPAERSIFDAIHKLPPAHTGTLVDGRLTLSPYWRLPLGVSSPRTGLAESAAAVRDGLREAVRLRLESDVPLGVFLSGGIDSSAVVASMRAVTSGRIATFSVSFGGAAPSYDERPYARLVAISASGCRSSMRGSRAGFATRRARWPGACPTRRRAGTGATGLGASPITPTPRCAIGTSAGRAFSAMRSWRDWQGRRCPRISSPGWTSPGRRRSPRLVTVTRWTARSGSI